MYLTWHTNNVETLATLGYTESQKWQILALQILNESNSYKNCHIESKICNWNKKNTFCQKNKNSSICQEDRFATGVLDPDKWNFWYTHIKSIIMKYGFTMHIQSIILAQKWRFDLPHSAAVSSLEHHVHVNECNDQWLTYTLKGDSVP